MKKPFNIAEVKANPRCRIETRDGKHHLEFILHDEATGQVVLRDIDNKCLIIFSEDGFWASPKHPDALDLFIEPELTAFEEYILNMINTYVGNEHLAGEEDAKRMGKELKELAYKEIYENLPRWRYAVAGTKLKGDAVIIYHDDKDARFGRCAIKDCTYFLVEDLLKFGACTEDAYDAVVNRMADALNTKFPEGITNEQIICEVIDRGLMADVIAQTADWLLEDALEKRKQARSSGGLGGIE